MPRYDTITTSLWQDRAFVSLSPTAKLLMFYLRTSPHSSILGYYHLRLEYVIIETGLTEAQIREDMAELEDAGIADYDDTTSHVLVVDYVKDTIIGVKSFVHAMREVRKSKRGVLFPRLLSSLRPLYDQYKADLKGDRQQEDAARFEATLRECLADTPAMAHRYPMDSPSIPPVRIGKERKGKEQVREGKDRTGQGNGSELVPHADEIFGKKADIEVTGFSS